MTARKSANSIRPAIEVRNLVKRFGKRTALAGLSLSIPEGVTYGLIGPNGAGKTTFIRIAVGLSKPAGGEIYVLGRAMPDRSAADHVGYMTQKSALYNDLTIMENLKFFAHLYGLKGNAAKERIFELLDLVDLEDRRDELVGNLSGGMLQRTSLAAALLHDPKLVFLDEPTAGVDPELRLAFWNHFETLKKRGTTLVVSTHHLDEASRCDMLGMLRAGNLIAEGAPGELLERAGADSLEGAFLKIARDAEAKDE